MSDTPPSALLERPTRLVFSSRPRPLIMGIVNVTPDSFYAGSRRPGAEDAIAQGLRMVEDGADLLDVGGVSTRPGSDGVGAEDESGRVLPVIEELSKRVSVPISIDTSKAVVAERALDAGARILNDILALRGEGMPAVAVRYPAVVLM
ncbi:MAG: dihydropteroate synthase, partial [Elusimicrobiota bacterium]